MVLVAGFADVDARWQWDPSVSTHLSSPLSFSFFSPISLLSPRRRPPLSPTPHLHLRRLLPSHRVTRRPAPVATLPGRAAAFAGTRGVAQGRHCHHKCARWRGRRADMEWAGPPVWRETTDGGSCRHHGRQCVEEAAGGAASPREEEPDAGPHPVKRSRRSRARPRAARPELCSSAGAPPCAVRARGATAAPGSPARP
jgi:hypothetical protein